MTALRNPAREALDAGRLSLGFTVRLVRSVEIAPAMAALGYDWLFLDCEHGTLSLDAAAQISVAALSAGIAPIVRVPNGRYAHGDADARTTARSASSCRMSIPRRKRAKWSRN